MHRSGRRSLLLAGVLMLAAGPLAAQQIPPEVLAYPELIIHNAKIVTMDDKDPNGTIGNVVQAMAVRGDTILRLGTNADVLRLAGPQTRRIDLKGRTVIPGMINTHNHLHGGYISAWLRKFPEEQAKMRAMENRRRFDVTGKTFEELTKGIELVIKEQMAGAPEDQWAAISVPSRGKYGFGIGTPYVIEGHMTRAQLDALAPKRPVSVSGEGVELLNTAARNKLFDLFRLDHTEEAEFFTMVGSGGNTPSNASPGQAFTEQFWAARIPLMADGLEDGLKHFAALGWTGFSSHIIGLRIYDAYLKLAREGRMPVRFGYADRNCQMMVVDIATCFSRKQDISGVGDKYFWNVGVTLGALDHDAPTICHTMEASPKINALQKCYAEPGGPYNDAIYTALRQRLRYVVNHVMGDKSMDQFMDIIERAMKDDPGLTLDYIRSLRLSADHCGWFPRQDQIARMARLNIQLSCGPKEIDDQGAFIPKIFGERYANRIVPMQSVFKGGLIVSLEETRADGLEEPAVTTFARSYPFITRKRFDGVSIAPEEAINRVQLIKMMTSNPAYFVMKEKELGTLEPGKLADFVVLNKDYFTIPQEDLPTVYPLMTVVGGKTIVLREELAREIGMSAVGPQLNFVYEDPGRTDRDEWVPDLEYQTGE
ncbi:MAG TPA: amidohydrolase family protein [Terriglobia bacterium]|nr:amidohydrolase family protein [Terriglobia bacterium]